MMRYIIREMLSPGLWVEAALIFGGAGALAVSLIAMLGRS